MKQKGLFDEEFKVSDFKNRRRGHITNTDEFWKSLSIHQKINIRANYGWNYAWLTCCFEYGYDMVGSVPKDFRLCNYIPDTNRYKKLFNWHK